jgi:hypothetical protein
MQNHEDNKLRCAKCCVQGIRNLHFGVHIKMVGVGAGEGDGAPAEEGDGG